ncbi:putative serine/threonine protein kinase IRE [Cardamine amara subsp. amara]|uniref:non-specific serine/threonine protein kinase n=1 Tax=Cardamine amara subsp. amara TaxID=228776 RepID=A0ABD1AQS6_CARAN
MTVALWNLAVSCFRFDKKKNGSLKIKKKPIDVEMGLASVSPILTSSSNRINPLPALETGQFEVSPTHSGPVESSEVGIAENSCELENQNESESPRYQALLDMTTNAPRKRFLGDIIKSFSQELNLKDVTHFPLWKPHRSNNSKEILNLIRTKFDKAKEVVNSDLARFGGVLLNLCETNKETHPELVVGIENLLVLVKRCAETTSGEFWLQCEGIVQDLDDKRKELPRGELRKLHTKMLFILTRCTRLLQFHKERRVSSAAKVLKVPSTKKAYSQGFVICPAPLSSPYNETSKDLEYKMSSWKRLPSLALKGVKEAASSSSKEQNDSKVKPQKVVKHRIAVSKRRHKISWGYWGDESFISEENSIICRICEKEVPTSHVKDHSRICALADKYNQKCSSVDEGLVAIAVTLEKVTNELIQKNSLAAVESSDSSLTEESDDLSPKLIEFLFRGKSTTFNEQDDIQQMSDLAYIARCSAKAIQVDDQSLGFLLHCLQELTHVILRRKFDALIVETFGTRIKKLLVQKYLQLCELLAHPKVDLSRTIIDENAPLEDDVVDTLSTSLVHPRTSIDDFEVMKSISSGAYGRVVLARKKTTGDLFAIKILRKADMIRKNAVESILAERDILSNVHNPFVVRFFYSFTCSTNLYLVMEYVNGGDLYSLLKQCESMYECDARVYIAEVVLALEYLHSEGIVHRDLKPDNLLIAHDGHLKLTDFGLSKVGLIDSTNDLSGPISGETSQPVEENKQSAVGTPDYLAPEILLGTGHGATADWWSVGVILYELLLGMPPFNADQPQQIFDNILNRNIQWPDVPDEMSHEAYDLINRLLTEDPRQRLGAKGAAEVKQHIFFKDINWQTLAQQKATFVPESNNPFDTSNFICRNPSNNLDEQCFQTNENEDSSDGDNLNGDGVDIPSGSAGFEANESENDSFDNFSVKNHLELAYINYDLCLRIKK